MVWMFIVAPKIYVEALTHDVVGFRRGILGKQLGLDEMMRVQPLDGINVFLRRGRDLSFLFLSSHYVRT